MLYLISPGGTSMVGTGGTQENAYKTSEAFSRFPVAYLKGTNFLWNKRFRIKFCESEPEFGKNCGMKDCE